MSAVPDHLPELVEHRVVARARAKASGFDDPVFDEEFSVDRTGDSFAIEMLDAIKAGTLKTRNRITGAVLPKPDENTLFHFVHPDDVNQWLASLGIEYRYCAESGQAANAEATGGRAADSDKATRAATTHRIKNRTRILDAEIQAAKSRAVNRDDPYSVWAELVKMAEGKCGSLIGHSSDGLQYKGKNYQDTGIPDVFTLKALRDRMGRDRRR